MNDRARTGGVLVLAGVACLGGGCFNTAATYHGDLSTDGIVARLPETPEPTTSSTAQPEPAVRVQTQAEARAGVGDVAVLTGPPPAAKEAPAQEGELTTLGASDGKRVEETFLVDSMVGQINGRPVYASEFFARMDARLRADARDMPPREWLVQTRRLIGQELRSRVRDELLLAEFEGALKPEQKQGLLAFLQQIRQEMVRENRGSEMLTRQTVEEEGLTVDQKVRQQRDRELIRQQLREKVVSRMTISWRDVVQAWEREPERFAPSGKARLRMIWVKDGDDERVQRVQDDLDSGQPFALVATNHSEWNPSEGGLVEKSLDKPRYTDSTIFGPAVLNDRAIALVTGETVGPFSYDGKQVWLTLESSGESDSGLYERQLEIYSALFTERFDAEANKYLRSLQERGSMTDMKEMEDALFKIAADRYLLQRGT